MGPSSYSSPTLVVKEIVLGARRSSHDPETSAQQSTETRLPRPNHKLPRLRIFDILLVTVNQSSRTRDWCPFGDHFALNHVSSDLEAQHLV